MKKAICIISLFFMIISCVTPLEVSTNSYQFHPNDPKNLTISNPSGEFRILQLADIQCATQRKFKAQIPLIDKLIKKAKPHLIVLSGDNICGPSGIVVLKDIINFLDSYNIPWSAVYGNHDQESSPKELQNELYQKAKHSLFKTSPKTVHGNSNYVVNLVDINGSPLFSIFHIDSNSYRKYSLSDKKKSGFGGTKYDFIYPSQIDWYEKNVRGIQTLNNGTIVPSIAFFHIALPEYRAYFNADPSDIVLPQFSTIEKVHCPTINTGFFEKIKELKSTKAIFVGHDHKNNFSFKHQGVILGYGVKTGTGSYYNPKAIGATVITLSNNFTKIDINRIFKSQLTQGEN